MKSATIPSVRVEAQLRSEVEALLQEGETLSEFVESAVRDTVQRRRNQADFIARGLASLQGARITGDYVDADAVVKHLEQKLALAKRRRSGPSR